VVFQRDVAAETWRSALVFVPPMGGVVGRRVDHRADGDGTGYSKGAVWQADLGAPLAPVRAIPQDDRRWFGVAERTRGTRGAAWRAPAISVPPEYGGWRRCSCWRRRGFGVPVPILIRVAPPENYAGKTWPFSLRRLYVPAACMFAPDRDGVRAQRPAFAVEGGPIRRAGQGVELRRGE